MTSVCREDHPHTFWRLGIVHLLLAFVILAIVLDKDPLEGILLRNKSLHIPHETLKGLKGLCYKAKFAFCLRSTLFYKSSSRLFLYGNHVTLIVHVKITLSSNFAEKQELSEFNILGHTVKKIVRRQQLPEKESPHYIHLFSSENQLSPYSLGALVIVLYRYQLIISRKAHLQNWKPKKTETGLHTMLPAFVLLSLSALGISTVIGFFTNLFIIVAHGMDRARGKTINPRELILFTLGLFNIAYQFSMVANDTVLYLWSDLYFSDNVYTIFSILLLFTIFSSFWFTFCLCGFYYVMLVTFEKTLFMRLKQNISEVVPWMLLSSVVLSFLISVPVAWNIKKENYTAQFNENVTDNSTIQQDTPHMNLQYLLVTSLIGCCIPLILVAISNILIIKTLYLHVKHLGKNAGGMNVQSVEASVSAARTVTSLLLLYISFYVTQILLIMAIFDVNSIWFSVCLVVIYAYSPVQSIILILGSPKLKSTLVRFFNSVVLKKKISSSANIKAIT